MDIERYVTESARFLGVTLKVSGAKYADISISNDTDVISAILLLLLMLLKRTANDGEIELEFKQSGSESILLCLRAELRHRIELDGTAELAECMRIASERNMMFDYFVSDDEHVSFEFSPSAVEWAHLGIKTRPVLEYDE